MGLVATMAALLHPLPAALRLPTRSPVVPLTLRVTLRTFTGNVTGQMHQFHRLYRYPYGLTGKMTPGGVYASYLLRIRFRRNDPPGSVETPF
jgi:hypothetical protein